MNGNYPTACGCTCSAYWVGPSLVIDKTRCPVHMPLPQKRLSPAGGGPNPFGVARVEKETGQ